MLHLQKKNVCRKDKERQGSLAVGTFCGCRRLRYKMFAHFLCLPMTRSGFYLFILFFVLCLVLFYLHNWDHEACGSWKPGCAP